MRKLVNRRSIVLLTLILFVSGSKAARTGPLEPIAGPPATAPAAGTVRLLTWNVAHGRADAFHQALLPRDEVERNLAAIAGILRHERPDVVALQEADGPSAWSGNFDHVSALALDSGLGHFYRGDHNPFGLTSYELSSGTALVSRLPLESTRSTPFAANWRDTKGFVLATVEIPGTGQELDVVSVHLDFLNPAERREQILALAAVLEGRDRPRVVLGDLNCEAASARGAFDLLAERLGVVPYEPALDQPTYPAGSPSRRLDWILASPELEFISYRAVEATLSDHLGVVAELRLVG
ncbi:MAG TPA: endonuclease/exonuclease/phosphatase family protein [Thermoanaerobaculia bacterium]|nr:endonuclease/exonuclease/phosphatase family protein [Thermoanaerobaculia bacterium]